MKDTKEIKVKQPIPWGYLAFAFLIIGAGVLLLVFPDESLVWAVRVIGIATMLLGILEIVRILSKKERDMMFFLKMLTAVLGLVGGGFFLFAPDKALEYLAMCAGIYLMIDGSFKLQTSILSRRFRLATWWFVLAMAVAAIAGGFFLIRGLVGWDAKGRAIFIGIFFLVDGLQNLVSTFYLPSIEKRRTVEIAKEYSTETVVFVPTPQGASVGSEAESGTDESETR